MAQPHKTHLILQNSSKGVYWHNTCPIKGPPWSEVLSVKLNKKFMVPVKLHVNISKDFHAVFARVRRIVHTLANTFFGGLSTLQQVLSLCEACLDFPPNHLRKPEIPPSPQQGYQMGN